MKILMLGWELPPHNSGGLGVACYQMCKHLALEGLQIDFVLPYRDEHSIDFMKVHAALSVSAEELVNLGGAYDSSNAPHDIYSQQQKYTEYVEQMIKNDEKPDVIHMHDWLTFEAGIRAKELTNKPLVAHVHATEFDRSGEHFGNPLVHDIEYNGLMIADAIIAVSQITKDIIVKRYGMPADKISVVHNSIDPSEFHSMYDTNMYVYLSEMKKRGYKVVVGLGRLTVQKGYKYLLEAAKQALQIDDKLLFLLAGSGELRNELVQQAADLGIAQNILFAGFVRGKAWRDAYTIGDMFVMSSVSEPFGLTALEAAGHDNAVLISKQSGVKEVLKNVLTFDYWDATRLANQIVTIAEKSNLQQELSSNIKHEFDHLSWHEAAEQYMQLYRRHAGQQTGVVV